tara:strand:- start:232 stop:567 length:336 start_codon:yes stop_codon:yes gene_type:complete
MADLQKQYAEIFEDPKVDLANNEQMMQMAKYQYSRDALSNQLKAQFRLPPKPPVTSIKIEDYGLNAYKAAEAEAYNEAIKQSFAISREQTRRSKKIAKAKDRAMQRRAERS